jgi:hypothetical protein
MPLGPTEVLIANHSSATMIAINMLAKCLVAKGSLQKGQFEQALQSILDHESSQISRPIHQWLAMLLTILEQDPNEVPKPN